MQVAKRNYEEFEIESYDLLLADVQSLQLQSEHKPVDVVIMNPPFGTRKKGMDIAFLKKAISVSY